MNDKKKKILESAIKLFSSQGIYQTSLKDIAMDADMSKGTLFYYFPSKDDILCEVMNICLNEITTTTKVVIADAKKISIEKAVKFNLEQLLISKDFLQKINFYLFNEALVGNDIITEKLKLQYATWRSEFKDIFIPSEKKLTDGQMNSIVTILLGIIDGVSLQYLLDPSQVDLEEIAIQIDKMFNNKIEVEVCK